MEGSANCEWWEVCKNVHSHFIYYSGTSTRDGHRTAVESTSMPMSFIKLRARYQPLSEPYSSGHAQMLPPIRSTVRRQSFSRLLQTGGYVRIAAPAPRLLDSLPPS